MIFQQGLAIRGSAVCTFRPICRSKTQQIRHKGRVLYDLNPSVPRFGRQLSRKEAFAASSVRRVPCVEMSAGLKVRITAPRALRPVSGRHC